MPRPFVLALSAVLLTLAAPAFAADYVHTDGSAAWVVPAGVTQVPDSRINAGTARFDIDRRGLAKAGTCVLGVSQLPRDANLETWATLKQTNQADPEAAGRKSVKPPKTFVRLGGYRPLTLRGGGDGYFFWVTARQADGREQTDVTGVGLIGTRRLYAATCSSEPGLAFTPAEIDRIFQLIGSLKQP